MLFVIISIRFFSITICNLLIESPSYIGTFLAGSRHLEIKSMLRGMLRDTFLSCEDCVYYYACQLNAVDSRNFPLQNSLAKYTWCMFS